jgi:hypothetical protein
MRDGAVEKRQRLAAGREVEHECNFGTQPPAERDGAMTNALHTATRPWWGLVLLLLSGCYYGYDHTYGYHHQDYPYGSYGHGYGAYPYPQPQDTGHSAQ